MPTVYHEYGTPLESPKEFAWMQYRVRNPDNVIAFSKNTHEYHPEVTNNAVAFLQQRFDHEFHPERVQFIKTSGWVPEHRDEVRKTCINIGIMNSSSATTYMISDDDAIKTSVVLRDGTGYIMDVTKRHRVEGGPERFLLSYGFIEPYKEVKRILKIC